MKPFIPSLNRFYSTGAGELTVPRFAVNRVRQPFTQETQLS